MIQGFWAAAEKDPDRLALVEADGARVPAGRLAASVNQVVHGLRARGLGPGDVVAVLQPNGAPLVEVLLAAMQAGWHYTPINNHLTASEVAFILADSGARAFVADARFAETAGPAAREAGLDGGACFARGAIAGFESYAELKAGRPETRPDDRLAGQFMQYTSGTTGRPKAVRRTIPPMDPDAMVAMLAPNLTRYDVEPGGDHVHLVTSPMYHMAPLGFAYFSLHFEHLVVLMDGWDAEGALRRIEEHRVTTTHMVPTQFQRLVRLPEETRARYDVASLRNVMHAAAPCPVELKRRLLAWWGPVVYEYYGATEGGGTLAKPDEWLAHPGTVGRPWPGAGVKILDDEGRELGPGEVGTVYLKLMMDFEYKGDPGKTREGRRGDYFTVGDVGELDAEGFLYLRDRKIDMIITGGVNVYPAEVEAALLAHPAVADAAVFGVPDDEWGEAVKAVVEPTAGRKPDAELEAALRTFCEERLARYKCPRSIDFVSALPRDPNGKLYKRKLRDPYWAGRERRI
ncbi:MAG TPA: acyl-CoA synthetase [Myxococcota bacterium]|nr:acyl-CoA synthetase [Myxococcota bacterium]